MLIAKKTREGLGSAGGKEGGLAGREEGLAGLGLHRQCQRRSWLGPEVGKMVSQLSQRSDQKLEEQHCNSKT